MLLRLVVSVQLEIEVAVVLVVCGRVFDVAILVMAVGYVFV